MNFGSGVPLFCHTVPTHVQNEGSLGALPWGGGGLKMSYPPAFSYPPGMGVSILRWVVGTGSIQHWVGAPHLT